MYPLPKDDNGIVLQGSQQRGKFPLGISVCSYSALPFGSSLALLHRQKEDMNLDRAFRVLTAEHWARLES